MQRLVLIPFVALMLSPLAAQPAKHPMLTIHRQRVVQSCGAVLDAITTSDVFFMSSMVGLTAIGNVSSAEKGKAYLGFWVPIPVILSAEEPTPDVVAGARIWSWPNPFRDHVSIDVQLPDRAMAEASVFSSIGKHVATLELTARHRDGVTFTWDGVCDDGASGATGTYLVRVFVQEPLRERRLVYTSSITRMR